MRFKVRHRVHPTVQVHHLVAPVQSDRLARRVADKIPDPVRRGCGALRLPRHLCGSPQALGLEADSFYDLQLQPELKVRHRAVKVGDASAYAGFDPRPMDHLRRRGLEALPKSGLGAQALGGPAHVQPHRGRVQGLLQS